MPVRRYVPPPQPVVDWAEEQRIAEMLEDGPEPQPEPEPAPAEEPWDDFMERMRRQEAERDIARDAIERARAAGERDRAMLAAQQPRPEPPNRIALGVGPNGVRSVGIWDAVMRRYNIQDEPVPVHRLDRDPFDNF